jgi:glycerol-3-phosphate dehydrogenase
MLRSEMLDRLRGRGAKPWDMLIVGGGATGVGIAVDAASRGYDVALVEQSDFGKGTSSRSTKLAHGGVRYLEQGNISLVMEALKERGLMRQNAPHLVHDLAFVVPNYEWWEAPFYGVGLKVYNMLAGKYGFGPSTILSPAETLKRLPTIKTEGLRGGIVYYDGQFDDARLLINMAETAAEQGATLANYVRVERLLKSSGGELSGAVAVDLESGREFEIHAEVVINATGAFTDNIRRMADAEARPMIAPSQGIHLVFPGKFLSSDHAIMVPHTSDGRVMFAIPWHGHTVVGTTDTPIENATLDPLPFEEEIDFILETSARYLNDAPAREDVLSVFVGIRPLVKAGGDGGNTAALSRDHSIRIESSGLVTITGGKWTTYRHMAEDCVNQAATMAQLEERPCVTRTLNIHGYHQNAEKFGDLEVYGGDAPAIETLRRSSAALAEVLDPELPYTAAEIVWAARHEMARTLDDVLARRTRALFLNSKAALRMAPKAAAVLARELGRDEAWERAQIAEFTRIATGYVLKEKALGGIA